MSVRTGVMSAPSDVTTLQAPSGACVLLVTRLLRMVDTAETWTSVRARLTSVTMNARI